MYAQQITNQFVNISFQALDCTGTDIQQTNKKQAGQYNWHELTVYSYQ